MVVKFQHQFMPSTINDKLAGKMDNKKPFEASQSDNERNNQKKVWNHHIRREKIHDYKMVRKKKEKTYKQSLVDSMERARLAEYAMYCEKPWRLLGMNFLIGVARGLGATIGVGLVLSLLVFLAQEVISANLPGISQWLAELVQMVQSYSIQR